METVITWKEFVAKQAGGRIYICRSCFDNRKKITLLKYIPGEKSETRSGMCSACAAAMKNCTSCKSKIRTIQRKW